jgi:ABC-type polysaccharide/polyol phosphate export permease
MPTIGIYSLNPMVGIITGYRAILLHGPMPGWVSVAASVGLSLLALFAGFKLFMRHEPDFADEL